MEKIKDYIFVCEDLDDKRITIGEYLKQLLITLWTEEEGFSGKRPFGNSGWKCDIYKCLIEHKACPGKLDEDGYIEEMDEEIADTLILKIIKDIFKGK